MIDIEKLLRANIDAHVEMNNRRIERMREESEQGRKFVDHIGKVRRLNREIRAAHRRARHARLFPNFKARP